jgi:hypothetical protein
VNFFLFGDDAADAEKRAEIITSALPFDLTGAPATVYDLDGPKSPLSADADEQKLHLMKVLEQMEINARKTGLAYSFAPIFEVEPRVGISNLLRFEFRPPASSREENPDKPNE